MTSQDLSIWIGNQVLDREYVFVSFREILKRRAITMHYKRAGLPFRQLYGRDGLFEDAFGGAEIFEILSHLRHVKLDNTNQDFDIRFLRIEHCGKPVLVRYTSFP